MSLGAKLLVGALVLGAAGTAGTYAVTNGGFGIGGNGEGSSENTQTASNQNTSATQEVSSVSSDNTEGREGSEEVRSSEDASLRPQPESGPSPQINVGDVPQTTDQISGPENANAQQQGQKVNVSEEVNIGGVQIQSIPGGAPAGTVADQNETGKAGTQTQPAPAKEDNPQKEGGGNIDPGKSKGETNSASLPVLGGAEDPKSPLQPSQDGRGQDQETTLLHPAVSNA